VARASSTVSRPTERIIPESEKPGSDEQGFLFAAMDRSAVFVIGQKNFARAPSRAEGARQIIKGVPYRSS
jgi:hypothetical protein